MMVEMASGSGCEMRKTSRGGLEQGIHLTLGIKSPSFVPDHGDKELWYITWLRDYQVRERLFTVNVFAQNDESGSRQREVRRSRRRVRGCCSRSLRKVCGGSVRVGGRKSPRICGVRTLRSQRKGIPVFALGVTSVIRSKGPWE